ncbi:MAG: hypothetical protein ACW981_16245 [Candidatus Hodarchaeales archaeon]|jgi:hypothetical protein
MEFNKNIQRMKENDVNSRFPDLLSFYAPLVAATLNTIFLVVAILQLMFRTEAEITTPPAGDLIALMLPSILLAPAFVITTVVVYRYASNKDKFWSLGSIAFACIYAVLVSIVYFVVMTVYIPHQLAGTTAEIQVLIYERNSFLYAINVLGYGYMSFSTLFLAPIFTGDGLEKYTRFFLLTNGILTPFMPLSMILPFLLYISALQGITFPASMILIAFVLKQSKSNKNNFQELYNE